MTSSCAFLVPPLGVQKVCPENKMKEWVGVWGSERLGELLGRRDGPQLSGGAWTSLSAGSSRGPVEPPQPQLSLPPRRPVGALSLPAASHFCCDTIQLGVLVPRWTLL